MTTPITVARPDDLGPALREVRQAEGMTQGALANAADVGRQWLNSFEMGEKPSAPLDMVMRVIAALDVPITLARPSMTPTLASEDEPTIDLDALLSGYDT